MSKLGTPTTPREALEVVRNDGSVSRDIKEVLERWHTDISGLFSGLRNNPDFAFDDDFYNKILENKTILEELSDDGNESDSCLYPLSNLNQD